MPDSNNKIAMRCACIYVQRARLAGSEPRCEVVGSLPVVAYPVTVHPFCSHVQLDTTAKSASTHGCHYQREQCSDYTLVQHPPLVTSFSKKEPGTWLSAYGCRLYRTFCHGGRGLSSSARPCLLPLSAPPSTGVAPLLLGRGRGLS